MKKNLKKQIKDLPKKPGVYLFRSEKERVLYVGKASSLKNRVSSYFQKSADLGPKTTLMVSKIEKIKTFQTPSEIEALLLEADLIKRLKPKYNQRMKDDKSYPLIEITTEKFPRVKITRQMKKGDYFGPFPKGDLRKILKTIRKVFPFRSCSDVKFKKHEKLKRGCLFYDLDLCPAPCAKKISKKEYQKQIKSLKRFLSGKGKKVLKNLEKRMRQASKEKKYELAAKLRDRLESLRYVRHRFQIKNTKDLNLNLPEDRRREKMIELKKCLSLKNLPRRIEAYDVSNIQGKKAVGSMVVFIDAEPKKKHYRRFRIKGGGKPNDTKMIKEILSRRFLRFKENGEDESFSSEPDLVLIDGGKGQLSAAFEVIRDKNIETEVFSIAKRKEQIFFIQNEKVEGPLDLKSSSPALLLLRHIRDESHRFAINYHRKLRQKI